MAFKVNNITVSIPPGLNGLSRTSLKFQNHKEKVIIVMGATGTGKSRLSIDLATHFPAEIINSDKIQVYKGLDIVTNKIAENECRGIPHHLLGMIEPNQDFTADDFRHHACLAIGTISDKGKVPIIAGGSNSLIESLNNDPYFRRKYECCFLFVDVSLPILKSFVYQRVDRMVEAGLVDEVRRFFHPNADYTKGLRRAIGVPEMDQFLNAERNKADEETLAELFSEATDKIKQNTYNLACKQLNRIARMRDFLGGKMHQIDATQVFLKNGDEANEAWEELVVAPSSIIVDQFLNGVGYDLKPLSIVRSSLPMKVMATATY